MSQPNLFLLHVELQASSTKYFWSSSKASKSYWGFSAFCLPFWCFNYTFLPHFFQKNEFVFEKKIFRKTGSVSWGQISLI